MMMLATMKMMVLVNVVLDDLRQAMTVMMVMVVNRLMVMVMAMASDSVPCSQLMTLVTRMTRMMM